jgi:hypothetical protein
MEIELACIQGHCKAIEFTATFRCMLVTGGGVHRNVTRSRPEEPQLSWVPVSERLPSTAYDGAADDRRFMKGPRQAPDRQLQPT